MNEQKTYKPQLTPNNSMLPGNPNRLPDESFFNHDTLLFVDETFLEKVSKYFGNGNYLKFDKIKFFEYLAKNQSLICKKIFYYTAPPFQNPFPTPEERIKREGYNKFINHLKERGVIVREGRCQRLKIDNKFEFKQKEVDVLLAVDLTNVPLDFPNIKKIILISSDSDFVPVVKNLQRHGIKTILYTYYERKRDTIFSRSNELIKSVYKYALLTKQDFENNPLVKKEFSNKQMKNQDNRDNVEEEILEDEE
jgi:uncharacterized LabA/DUF88 family protein